LHDKHENAILNKVIKKNEKRTRIKEKPTLKEWAKFTYVGKRNQA
jgi:hypothetical protein